MKKLIATAVAATVSAYAVADISITGSMKANYTVTDYADSRKADTDKFSTEGDLKILGKSGDTTVVMNFGNIDSAEGDTAQTMTAEDTYVKTKIGDVSVQMGNYDSGNNEMRDSSRVNRVKLSTDIAGFGVSYTNGNGGDGANDEVGISTTLGGVKLAYTAKDAADGVSASTSVGGVNLKYAADNKDAANSDRSYIELSTELQGVSVKVGKAEAETSTRIGGDSWMGDFEDSTYTNADSSTNAYDLTAGQDVTGIELATSVAGNKLTFRSINIDDVAGDDTDITKVIVTRPLASGATLEVTYTDVTDAAHALTDSETLDIELAVKF